MRLERAQWARWIDTAGAAGIGFLWLLAAGALLLVAAKLDFPSLGSRADPIEVLTAVVLFGLACLRASVHVDGVTISLLPLAALAVVGWGFSDAVRRTVARLPGRSRARQALAGAASAVPFGVLCCAAALIFRFDGGTTPIRVDAVSALIAGLVWGGVFGAIGGLTSDASLKVLVRTALLRLVERADWIGNGVTGGLWMSAAAATLGSAAVLLAIIFSLVRGGPPGIRPADAVAAAIYLVAFWPNVVAAAVTISLGGYVQVGARVGLNGKAVGVVRTYSYYGWGHRSTWWPVLLLVCIPIAATAIAGMLLAMNHLDRARALRSVVVAAFVFASVMAVVAAIGSARLGAGLLGRKGLAGVDAVAWETFVLAAAWGVVGGTAGWMIADRRASKRSAS